MIMYSDHLSFRFATLAERFTRVMSAGGLQLVCRCSSLQTPEPAGYLPQSAPRRSVAWARSVPQILNVAPLWGNQRCHVMSGVCDTGMLRALSREI